MPMYFDPRVRGAHGITEPWHDPLRKKERRTPKQKQEASTNRREEVARIERWLDLEEQIVQALVTGVQSRDQNP